MKECKKVAIIGAGAAGYFAALSVAQHHPNAEVTLYEKTAKVLSKVKISETAMSPTIAMNFQN